MLFQQNVWDIYYRIAPPTKRDLDYSNKIRYLRQKLLNASENRVLGDNKMTSATLRKIEKSETGVSQKNIESILRFINRELSFLDLPELRTQEDIKELFLPMDENQLSDKAISPNR